MKILAKVWMVFVWLVAVWLAVKFVPNGWDKFNPHGFWSAPFERWGYPVWFRWLVGIAEVGGGVAILVPRLAAYGAPVLFIVMVGAFVTRMGSGQVDDLIAIAIYAAAIALVGYQRWPVRWRVSTPDAGGGGAGNEAGDAR